MYRMLQHQMSAQSALYDFGNKEQLFLSVMETLCVLCQTGSELREMILTNFRLQRVNVVSGSRSVFHNQIKRTAFEGLCCVRFLVYLMRLVKSLRCKASDGRMLVNCEVKASLGGIAA
jgi:hypothetical protein